MHECLLHQQPLVSIFIFIQTRMYILFMQNKYAKNALATFIRKLLLHHSSNEKMEISESLKII